MVIPSLFRELVSEQAVQELSEDLVFMLVVDAIRFLSQPH